VSRTIRQSLLVRERAEAMMRSIVFASPDLVGRTPRPAPAGIRQIIFSLVFLLTHPPHGVALRYHRDASQSRWFRQTFRHAF